MKKNIYRRKIIFMILILIVVIALTNVFSFAKYTANKVFNYYLDSKGFYFYSDSLSEIGIENVNTLWDGEKTYFEINNGLSDSQVSEFDIEYEINCTVKDESDKKCYINGTGLEKVSGILSAYESCTDTEENGKKVNYLDKNSCEEAGYDWSFKKISFQPYFEVISTDSNTDISSALVEITVTTTKPYKKVLKGTYWLVRNQNDIGELAMVFEEKEVLSSLTISNSYDVEKCVELNWNKTKILLAEDIDDLQVGTPKDSSYKTIYFKVPAKNSTIFNYFKSNKNVLINNGDFTLIESDLCQ